MQQDGARVLKGVIFHSETKVSKLYFSISVPELPKTAKKIFSNSTIYVELHVKSPAVTAK